MAGEGYQKPPNEISDATRDLHRALLSLQEELEAVDWYGQRIDACKDPALRAVLAHHRDEEKEHAAMLPEWIRRQDEGFAKELRDRLFTDKPLVHDRGRRGGRRPALTAPAAAARCGRSPGAARSWCAPR